MALQTWTLCSDVVELVEKGILAANGGQKCPSLLITSYSKIGNIKSGNGNNLSAFLAILWKIKQKVCPSISKYFPKEPYLHRNK